jgi:PAS domain S-box-containing protein
MPDRSSANAALAEANKELRARLVIAEEMLRAIRAGDVDALVIQSDAGPQIYLLQGQDAEANRFRGEMLAQVSDAVIAVDLDGHVIYINAAAALLYGVTADKVLGLYTSDIYTTLWAKPADHAASITALERDNAWRGENVHVTHDGRHLDIESSITILLTKHGKANGRLAVGRDITARKQHEEKVLISEIRYRRLFETAHDGVLILNPVTRKIIDANPYMTVMLDYTYTQLVGKELWEIGLLTDQAASQEMFNSLTLSKQVRYDNLPLISQSGRHQDVEVVANLYDENGVPVIQCNIRDITARKHAEEHVQLLIAEVNHRAKNLLAVVQAVADQTAKYGDPAGFVARLSDRIDALAAGQDLLVKNLWQGVEVGELVVAQLSHFKDLIGTRILIDGPSALLTTGATQGIGMALHELSTNAAKYGALAAPEGRVNIAWDVSTADPPEFTMSWTEFDGPATVAPTRTGFGQIVIGRMAEAAVDGNVEVTFAPAGLSWKLRAPAENVLAQAGRSQFPAAADVR